MLAFIHHTVGWLDPITLALLVGGLIGTLARCGIGQQRTRSRRTLYDVLMGGAFAGIVPQVAKWFGIELAGPTLFWLLLGVCIGGYGNVIVVALLWRIGIFKSDPRADKPDNGATP